MGKINYDTLEISKLSADELFTYLNQSEIESMQNKKQGEFYYRICFDPHFKKIMSSTLKGIDEDLIVNAFYHCLRHNKIYKFNPKNYPLFLKAFQKLLPDLAENAPYICGFNRFNAILLFDIKDITDEEKLYQSSIEEFFAILEFINKANTYTAYPYVRKNHEKLTPFLENSNLMNRIRKGFSLYKQFEEGISLSSDFTMTIAASLVLLLKDSNLDSKNMLLNFHQENLSRKLVWVLGSFYKDFVKINDNKKLLDNLYEIYEKSWIDIYE